MSRDCHEKKGRLVVQSGFPDLTGHKCQPRSQNVPSWMVHTRQYRRRESPRSFNQTRKAELESVGTTFSNRHFIAPTLLLVLAKDAANQITPEEEFIKQPAECEGSLLRSLQEAIDCSRDPQLSASIFPPPFQIFFLLLFVKLQTFKIMLPGKCPAKRLPGIIRYRNKSQRWCIKASHSTPQSRVPLPWPVRKKKTSQPRSVAVYF